MAPATATTATRWTADVSPGATGAWARPASATCAAWTCTASALTSASPASSPSAGWTSWTAPSPCAASSAPTPTSRERAGAGRAANTSGPTGHHTAGTAMSLKRWPTRWKPYKPHLPRTPNGPGRPSISLASAWNTWHTRRAWMTSPSRPGCTPRCGAVAGTALYQRHAVRLADIDVVDGTDGEAAGAVDVVPDG